MQRYSIEKSLGGGAYGEVYLALDRRARPGDRNRRVAVKSLKKHFPTQEETLREREVSVLRNCQGHAGVVLLLDLVHERFRLHMVFEFMDTNVLDLIQEERKASGLGGCRGRRSELPLETVKSLSRQLLAGLAFLHARGYMHRDVKPENLLVNRAPGNVLRLAIADFGLARSFQSRPPYSDCFCTMWYRAPECLLLVPRYGPPVDVWAAGCVVYELLALEPLFAGSSELDQLGHVVSGLGVPSPRAWPEGLRQAASRSLVFPNLPYKGLAQRLAEVADRARLGQEFRAGGGGGGTTTTTTTTTRGLPAGTGTALAETCRFFDAALCWNPQQRASCKALANHPFLAETQASAAAAAAAAAAGSTRGRGGDGGVADGDGTGDGNGDGEEEEQHEGAGRPAMLRTRSLSAPEASPGRGGSGGGGGGGFGSHILDSEDKHPHSFLGMAAASSAADEVSEGEGGGAAAAAAARSSVAKLRVDTCELEDLLDDIEGRSSRRERGNGDGGGSGGGGGPPPSLSSSLSSSSVPKVSKTGLGAGVSDEEMKEIMRRRGGGGGGGRRGSSRGVGGGGAGRRASIEGKNLLTRAVSEESVPDDAGGRSGATGSAAKSSSSSSSSLSSSSMPPLPPPPGGLGGPRLSRRGSVTLDELLAEVDASFEDRSNSQDLPPASLSLQYQRSWSSPQMVSPSQSRSASRVSSFSSRSPRDATLSSSDSLSGGGGGDGGSDGSDGEGERVRKHHSVKQPVRSIGAASRYHRESLLAQAALSADDLKDEGLLDLDLADELVDEDDGASSGGAGAGGTTRRRSYGRRASLNFKASRRRSISLEAAEADDAGPAGGGSRPQPVPSPPSRPTQAGGTHPRFARRHRQYHEA